MILETLLQMLVDNYQMILLINKELESRKANYYQTLSLIRNELPQFPDFFSYDEEETLDVDCEVINVPYISN